MKILEGVVKSFSQNTAIVEVTRKVPHPMYKKLLKKGSSFKADLGGSVVKIGDMVKISETRPFSKQKYFKLVLTKEIKK